MHHSIAKKDALSAAMKLCSREERCIFDVREKLEKWGLHEKDMDEVIGHLVENKYIDENRYATFFINDKFHLNKWGKLKLKQALKLKSLPEEIISNGLNGINETEYLEVLRSEMQKKLHTIHEGTVLDKKAKLFRFGAARGFENDHVYKVIDEIIQ
jgi:regulatory protein